MAMMRGTTFTIPDLEEILKDFPRGTHPELNRLREYANAKLEKYVWLRRFHNPKFLRMLMTHPPQALS